MAKYVTNETVLKKAIEKLRRSSTFIFWAILVFVGWLLSLAINGRAFTSNESLWLIPFAGFYLLLAFLIRSNASRRINELRRIEVEIDDELVRCVGTKLNDNSQVILALIPLKMIRTLTIVQRGLEVKFDTGKEVFTQTFELSLKDNEGFISELERKTGLTTIRNRAANII